MASLSRWELAEKIAKACAMKVSPWDVEVQKVGFAYGNLACSTNHKPTRAGFNKMCLERGWTQEQFDEWAKDKEWTDVVRKELQLPGQT